MTAPTVPTFVWLFRDDATTAKGPEGTNLRLRDYAVVPLMPTRKLVKQPADKLNYTACKELKQGHDQVDSSKMALHSLVRCFHSDTHCAISKEIAISIGRAKTSEN